MKTATEKKRKNQTVEELAKSPTAVTRRATALPYTGTPTAEKSERGKPIAAADRKRN